MKKLLKSSKYIKYLKRASSKKASRTRKGKDKLKAKRRQLQGISKIQKTEIDKLSQYTIIPAPRDFSFIKNVTKTAEFIQKLESLYVERKKAYVDLSKITLLDYSAISVLVSVMFTFKSRNIEFNGNFPKDQELKRLLIDSDFFKYLNKPIGNKLEYSVGKKNQIFTRANKEVNSELGFMVMEEASQTIWGEKRTCKGLQRTLLELMHNTNNHADHSAKGVKHWWLSVNHNEKERKVSFAFIDYGIGIFESLKKKPHNNKWHKFYDKISELKYGSNDEILKQLLEGEIHMTVTGQHFRGKGLPGIKQVQDRNQIEHLHIISNDVFADVQNDNYQKISSSFSGTFAYWEINETNENSKWIL